MSGDVDIFLRRRLTAAERRALLERQDFRCAVCPKPLVAEVGERRLLAAMVDEHVIPLALGGANDLTNRELRCPALSPRSALGVPNAPTPSRVSWPHARS